MKTFIICSSFIVTAFIGAACGGSSPPPAAQAGANATACKVDCVDNDCSAAEPKADQLCPPNNIVCKVDPNQDQNPVSVCVAEDGVTLGGTPIPVPSCNDVDPQGSGDDGLSFPETCERDGQFCDAYQEQASFSGADPCPSGSHICGYDFVDTNSNPMSAAYFCKDANGDAVDLDPNLDNQLNAAAKADETNNGVSSP